jgi:hypothetical protein
MKYVWDNADEGVISNDAWMHLKTLVDETLHKSRASVIFFLDAMTEDGFLVKSSKTGKGGHHGVWKPSPDFPCEEAYMREMAMRMVKSAEAILNVTFMVKQSPVD